MAAGGIGVSCDVEAPATIGQPEGGEMIGGQRPAIGMPGITCASDRIASLILGATVTFRRGAERKSNL
ncbi:hypothetical protein NXC14_PB00321 (plasmid) [Rhizobium sp. NXC14]|nr:hypothetical protein NXC14_PB00321 [Rhizobium sp. NXC14]